MTTVERITERRFIAITIYNLTFHVVKCTMYFVLDGHFNSRDRPWYFKKNIWDAFFVFSLAFLVVLTGIRLLSVSRSHHISAYRTHKTQIRIMMICILVCEPSNFYAVFMHDNKITDNVQAGFVLQMCLLLFPVTVYLFIKKTEDCLACFNRYPTRYSSY